jgi:hypothetical protein
VCDDVAHELARLGASVHVDMVNVDVLTPLIQQMLAAP